MAEDGQWLLDEMKSRARDMLTFAHISDEADLPDEEDWPYLEYVLKCGIVAALETLESYGLVRKGSS